MMTSLYYYSTQQLMCYSAVIQLYLMIFCIKIFYLISHTIWQVLQFQAATGVEQPLLLKYFVLNLTEIILPGRGLLMFLHLTTDHILNHLPSPVVSACLNHNRERVLFSLLLLFARL